MRRASVLLRIAAVVVLVLLMVWARALYGAAEAHRKGKECLGQNRIPDAITYFDRAVHWYAPLNPWAARSAERLWAVSEKAETEGDCRLALRALNAIRSGYLAADGIFSPGRGWIRRCDERIRRISASACGGSVSPGLTEGADAGSGRPPSPNLYWTLVLEVGLLGWIGIVIWLILGYGRKKRTSRNFVKWGVLLFFCFAAWIVGMMMA